MIKKRRQLSTASCLFFAKLQTGLTVYIISSIVLFVNRNSLRSVLTLWGDKNTPERKKHNTGQLWSF